MPNPYRAVVTWLDARLFPLLIAYTTHPLTILATLLLLIPLFLGASNVIVGLVASDYLNVIGASVSSIVLMQSLKHHRENRQMHADHAATLATIQASHDALHAKVDALTPPPPPTTPAVVLAMPPRDDKGRFLKPTAASPPPAADTPPEEGQAAV